VCSGVGKQEIAAMMPHKFLFASLALSLGLGAFATGCTAETSEDPTEEAEDDLTAGAYKSKLLGEVAAIKIRDITIGNKAKVGAVLRTAGLGSRNRIPDEGGYRCMPGYRIEFLGPKGNVVAQGGLQCGSDARTGVHKGSVQVNGKSYLIDADVGIIEGELAKPVTASDFLWGTNKVELRTRMGAKATSDAALVADVLKGVGDKLELLPDNTPEPRCLPARVLSFKRGTADIGYITSSCGEDSGTGAGKLRIDGKRYALTLNFDKIAPVEASLGIR
jgi:hypothetical protein